MSPDIFRWGGGLPREGVGAKKFGMPLEPREIKLFLAGYPGILPGYPGAPEKFEEKKIVFNSRALMFRFFFQDRPWVGQIAIFQDFRGGRILCSLRGNRDYSTSGTTERPLRELTAFAKRDFAPIEILSVILETIPTPIRIKFALPPPPRICVK